MTEATRYPGYDVLAKRRGPSWNEATRRVVEHRMAVPHEPRFLPPDLFRILDAVCARILPQPKDRPPVPLAARRQAAPLQAGHLPVVLAVMQRLRLTKVQAAAAEVLAQPALEKTAAMAMRLRQAAAAAAAVAMAAVLRRA